jgi:hypothetical protein
MPILLRRAPQVTAEFGLSAGKGLLLAAKPGDAPLAGGGQRAAFHALASPVEHQLITTDPAELAAAGGLTGQEYSDPLSAPRAGELADW